MPRHEQGRLALLLSLAIATALQVVGVVALPAIGYAQEATVSGTVTDSTGGVLPGVVVRAVHEASGNNFEAVTDEHGVYRLAVRTGTYRLTAELTGFATIIRTGLELLLAQQAILNLEMAPSAVQEAVTVTGESPLIDVTQSRVSGNISPRQMQELPVNGRNWQQLTMLAAGSRTNAVTDSSAPIERGVANSGRMISEAQLNLDGQQVTNSLSNNIPAPRLSRDAIGEFEFVANRFDATQGRSLGSQVNAITKSGTNAFSGTAAGYFRSDRLMAADHITGRVLPYSNQQLSSTFGGPIRRDRIHFFGSYEYEREPITFFHTSPYPKFNFDLHGINRQHLAIGRLDGQFTSSTRLVLRANTWYYLQPYGAGGGSSTSHPSTRDLQRMKSNALYGALTQVLSNRALNEVKVGYFMTERYTAGILAATNHPKGLETGVTDITLLGYSIGGGSPQWLPQHNLSFRDDFSYSFSKGGRHDLKVGGEYIHIVGTYFDCTPCLGTLDAQGGPIPANIEDLFPVWNDATTWNLLPLAPISRSWEQGIGDPDIDYPREVYAGWLQDDWAVTPRLTLNLGLRYDLIIGALAEDVELLPFLEAGRPADKNNVGPRVGFAFSLDPMTVLRGGFGKYFGDVTNQIEESKMWTQFVRPVVLYDGRPDFPVNPYNGPPPTLEQLLQRRCSVVRQPGCVRLDITGDFGSADLQFPHSYQTSVGVQRQLGNTMAIETDYVYIGGRNELFTRNNNLSYNPATGANYSYTDVSRLPYPDFGKVVQWVSLGSSDYHGWQTAFTKRFSSRWQASASYLLSQTKDGEPPPITEFPVAPDLGGEYGLAASDQRHRAVFNGIWQVGYGFQLSGLYFYGSGQRFYTRYGGDLRNSGRGNAQPGSGRLRPDGTIVPRNNLVGDPIHRVDLRLQRRFGLGGRAGVDGIVEVFNLFNHANYGAYTTQESSRSYGQPSQSTNVAYQPRMAQLGVRFSF